jgi:hypothetical protein
MPWAFIVLAVFVSKSTNRSANSTNGMSNVEIFSPIPVTRNKPAARRELTALSEFGTGMLGVSARFMRAGACAKTVSPARCCLPEKVYRRKPQSEASSLANTATRDYLSKKPNGIHTYRYQKPTLPVLRKHRISSLQPCDHEPRDRYALPHPVELQWRSGAVCRDPGDHEARRSSRRRLASIRCRGNVALLCYPHVS